MGSVNFVQHCLWDSPVLLWVAVVHFLLLNCIRFCKYIAIYFSMDISWVSHLGVLWIKHLYNSRIVYLMDIEHIFIKYIPTHRTTGVMVCVCIGLIDNGRVCFWKIAAAYKTSSCCPQWHLVMLSWLFRIICILNTVLLSYHVSDYM